MKKILITALTILILPAALNAGFSFGMIKATKKTVNKVDEQVVIKKAEIAAQNIPPSNSPPVLSWTGEVNYVSDGLNPETGGASTSFIYRVKYVDPNNDAPASGYPQVHIKKGGVEVPGSPFTMSFISGAYNTGAIYSYLKVITSTGTDYTYYFEAQDLSNAVATGVPTSPIDSPDLANSAPTLSWTNETNYVSDGLDPETGDAATSFIYRIKYTDADNDAPLSGYPKVHIKKSGVEIAGSPFVMTYVSGQDNTGAIYSYSEVITSTGTNYTYYFEAQDSSSAVAIGAPTSPIDAPDVSNSAPILSWTGESNYISDGLDPETGNAATSFVYRIKYTDANNDAPLSGYPKVHIKKSGVEITGSPFTMTYVSGANSTGAIYSYSKVVATVGADYTYYFEAQDSSSAVATGAPTTPIDAPDVANSAPVLSWTGEANYVSDGLNPETGDAPTSFTYRVKYTDADNDAPYGTYPKVHIRKGGVEIPESNITMTYVSGAYSTGAIYTYTEVIGSTGTDYTYYFEALDSNSAVATGAPTSPIDAPDVPNSTPVLYWTGEANYVSDGLDPETGDASTSFIYRARYFDADNEAPQSGYPKVHIKKGGVEIAGSPFVMTYVSGSNTWPGTIYTYAKVLATVGADYTYYFEAQDPHGAVATGTPASPIDAPDFTCGTVSDGDGHIYNTIQIGAQCWTKENMEYDGSSTGGGCTAVTYVNHQDVGWCTYYAGGPFTDEGLLYQWSAMMNGSTTEGAQGICPTGWHIPTHNDWTTLERLVCTSGSCATDFPYDTSTSGSRGTDEGGKLLSGGSSGFAGLLAGYISENIDGGGSAYLRGLFLNLWSSTGSGGYAWVRGLSSGSTLIGRGINTKKADAYSVRCLKIVGNTAPTLSWTGEVNYVSDGLNPETGDDPTSFIYRVKYTDANNDAPANGYPLVHIKKGGVEIAGSPVSMVYVSGTYNTGAIYTYTKVIDTVGTDYTYYFEAQDLYGATATGVATSPVAAPEVTLFTCGVNTMLDGDNHVYHTVQIGTQCWMKENMEYDGSPTGSGCTGVTWVDNTDVGWCGYYSGGPYTDEGLLYQWSALAGICPSGWHIPTHDEWTTLERAVCTSGSCVTDFPYNTSTIGWRGTNEGTNLKSGGSSGFDGLLSGERGLDGTYSSRGSHEYRWSATPSGSSAWARHLGSTFAPVDRRMQDKAYGFGARCLRD